MDEPLARIELSSCVCTCISWANSEILAIGMSNGEWSYREPEVMLINRESGTNHGSDYDNSTQPIQRILT